MRDPASKAAYIQAKVASMLAEIASMQAANQHRLSLGQSIAYDEAAFADLPLRFGLGENAVITFLRGE